MTTTLRKLNPVVEFRPARSGGARPLKLLCLNYEYPPMGGGAGNATQHTAKELTRRGHEVHVITSRLPRQATVDRDARVVIYRVYSKRKSIHEAGLAGALTYLLGAFFKLRRLSRINDYDIFHFYFGLPTGLLALYVHHVLKKPYVVALRGSDVPGYDNTRWYLRPLHKLAAPMTRHIWSNAAAVTALSESLRALAQDTCPHVSIAVIRNGIDPSVFPSREPARRKRSVRLICVSRLVKRKGLEYLLAALPELKSDGVTLDIIGTGEQQSHIRSMVRRLGVEDCVNLIGYIPRESLAEFYHRADIFVLPSLSESFGQVLLEAMSCGLPVIASRVGGIPETLEHEKGGLLIEPGNSEAIIGAVRKLAADPLRRNSMSEYNRHIAVNEFGWSRIAEQYEKLYRKILDRSEHIAARKP